MAKFSAQDAGRLADYGARLEAISGVLRELALHTPPNVTNEGWLNALPELLRSARVGRRLARLDASLRQTLLTLFAGSAGD